MKIPEEQKADYKKLLDAREDARSRRDKLSKELGSTDNKELKAQREDLEKLKKENPDTFTKEQQAELDKINERSKTLSEINEQSRKLGEKASESYVRSKYPKAELVYGGANANSQSEDFDQVWRVPAKNPGESDTWIGIDMGDLLTKFPENLQEIKNSSNSNTQDISAKLQEFSEKIDIDNEDFKQMLLSFIETYDQIFIIEENEEEITIKEQKEDEKMIDKTIKDSLAKHPLPSLKFEDLL